MTDEELRKRIAAVYWHRTHYIAEHQYFMRTDDEELYVALVERIIRGGEGCHDGEFRGWPYRYLDLDGWTYWHFDTLINRRLTKNV